MKKILGAIAVFVLIFAGCSSGPSQPKEDNIQQADQKVTQDYYKKLRDATPYPLEEMNFSLERVNLREKLLRFNDPNKIGYVYLLSDMGDIISFFTVKGKVSSTQSQMTTQEQVEYYDRCGNSCYDKENVISTAPGDDGSFGENETGIFFFTTEDVYVTWNGRYLYLDAPLQIDEGGVAIELPEGAAPTSVGEAADERYGD